MEKRVSECFTEHWNFLQLRNLKKKKVVFFAGCGCLDLMAKGRLSCSLCPWGVLHEVEILIFPLYHNYYFDHSFTNAVWFLLGHEKSDAHFVKCSPSFLLFLSKSEIKVWYGYIHLHFFNMKCINVRMFCKQTIIMWIEAAQLPWPWAHTSLI